MTSRMGSNSNYISRPLSADFGLSSLYNFYLMFAILFPFAIFLFEF